MCIHEGGLATHQRDVGVGEDDLYALTQLGDDLAHALTSILEGGAVHIGLRGDAANIEAGAAYVTLFNDGDLQTVLGGMGRSLVAAGPCADDDDITHSSMFCYDFGTKLRTKASASKSYPPFFNLLLFFAASHEKRFSPKGL